MKKNILYSLIFLQIFLVTLPSCRINAQSTRSISYNASLKHELSPFKAIHVGDGFEVEILHSDKYSCEIFAQTMDNVNAIEPMIKKGELSFKNHIFPILGRKGPIKVKIYAPNLEAISLSGGANGTSDIRFSSNKFYLDLSGGASLKEIQIKCDELLVNMSGGSILKNISVQARNAKVDLSGGSDWLSSELQLEDNLLLDLSGGSRVENFIGGVKSLLLDCSAGSKAYIADFIAKNCSVDLSGAARAKIQATEEIEVEASGASTLYYKGTAKMNKVDVSGVSSVKQL